jgi:glycosyltransferase involved in cell wall biosynthesis
VNNIEHIVLASRGKRMWSAAVRLMERSWYRHADLLIAVSPADGRRLRDLLGPACPQVEIVPNGMDPPPAEVAEADLPHPNVVFLGKTDYPPNADAIAVLQREWLPEARRRGMEATAVIAGGPALPGVREGMVFTGYVEDVWPVISAADVCVAPLTAGSGTRLKVLTYLAAEKPVIATEVAVEGLGMEPRIHYLRAESGEEFAEALEYLRRDPGGASRLAARGRALSAEFSWATIGAHWSEVLRSRVGH